MGAGFRHLRIGYQLSESNISMELTPLLHETVASYRCHHDDLLAVYVVGSVALGEWRRGVSDLDVIGISNADISTVEDEARRRDLAKIGNSHTEITFIDNAIIGVSKVDTRSEPSLLTQGVLSKLALTGVSIWGYRIDFGDHMPTLHDMTYGRMERAEALMKKYRSGNLIDPFRRDASMLTRSCAKAAMRVLSSMTLLRGATYHSSPYQTAEEVSLFVPEATELSKRAMAIINDPDDFPEIAMEITDQAIALFSELFPVESQGP